MLRNVLALTILPRSSCGFRTNAMADHQLFVIYRDKINELRQTIKDLQQTTTNLRVRIDILEEKN